MFKDLVPCKTKTSTFLYDIGYQIKSKLYTFFMLHRNDSNQIAVLNLVLNLKSLLGGTPVVLWHPDIIKNNFPTHLLLIIDHTDYLKCIQMLRFFSFRKLLIRYITSLLTTYKFSR